MLRIFHFTHVHLKLLTVQLRMIRQSLGIGPLRVQSLVM